MTADEFAALARSTGFTDAELGYALGAAGDRKNVAARVRQWKRGARPIPAEVAARLQDLAGGSRIEPLQKDRLSRLGATVFQVPTPEEIPNLVARLARLWAELHEADRDLALELARKLPTMKIRRQ